ncbi:hypothetical protein TrLO_g4258 [Triparma laevis f. longispina]|uniref:Wntless-like transmembrane domain-containing protein n=1 Tax=Triparma laevis f. longispina TaxID=1714387 RepID=A0A9W6Z7D6_9STRA|nr:hypothetical protein TrLO_g4258 [Triparma laevis f. longispina]
MENQSFNAVRIESSKFGKRGVLCTAVMFFLTFAFTCVMGKFGPEVFESHEGSSKLRINRAGVALMSTWVGNLVNLVPENQLLWVTCNFERPDSINASYSFDYNQEVYVTVLGSHMETDEFLATRDFDEALEDGADLIVARKLATRKVDFKANAVESGDITIFNLHTMPYKNFKVKVEFVDAGDIDKYGHANHEDHQMNVRFTMRYVNRDYTSFEFSWKYTFCIITLVVMFFPSLNRGGLLSRSRMFTSFSLIFEGFTVRLWGTKWKMWSYQQKWIMVLLIQLFFFNDPLIYFEVYNSKIGGEILGGVYIGMMAIFICTLMLFWLCALDETRDEKNLGRRDKNGCKKHLAKILFMGVFWVYLVATYAHIRMQEKDDPTYEAAQEGDRFVAATAFGGLLTVIYTLWFLYYTFKGMWVLCTLPPPFLFVFSITFFTFAATVVGIFIAALYPVPSAALDFLGMYSLYNLYIWTMAFVYAPLKNSANDVDEKYGVMEFGGELRGPSMIGDIASQEEIDDMQL